MQAALFGLGLLPPPPPGAQIFSRQRWPRARRAADRAVTLVIKPVVRHVVRADVLPHRDPAPRRERIEFLEAVRGVELTLGQFGSIGRLFTALAGDPGPFAGKRARQPLDLADLAAALSQVRAPVEPVPPPDPPVFPPPPPFHPPPLPPPSLPPPHLPV